MKRTSAGRQRGSLEAILDILPVGVWRADARCERVIGNRAAYEMLNLPYGINASVTATQVVDELSRIKFLVDGKETPADKMPVQRAAFHGESIRHVIHQAILPDGQVRIIDANVEPLRDETGRLNGAIAAYLDITAQKQVESQLRESQERIAADLRAVMCLYEVGNRCANAGNDRDQCLKAILDAAIFLTGADKGNLQIRDPDSGALSIAVHRGFERPFLDFFARVHDASAAACGAAMAARERVSIEDVARSEVFAGRPSLEILLAAGVRAVQSTPLVNSAGNVLGMISTHFVRPTRVDERALRYVDLLARQCADFLERGQAERRLRQTEGDLLWLNAELLQADRQKNRFLAVLAHELRNPLAPIRNAVEIQKMDGVTDAQLKWSRDVIARQVTQMARLLDDLLEISRITSDKLELRKERVTLSSVLESAVETSQPFVNHREHRLDVELPSEPIHVEADPIRLAQVFSNLLNNAAKYTPDRGRIEVRASREGQEAVVSISDTGIGIDADALPRLFRMFSQSASALDLAQGGLGVGLSLVKGLVEMHGGRVEARSDGAGKGSEFVVRLPLAPRPMRGGSERAAGRAARSRGDKRRVLVVDDLKDSADSLAALLEVMGHEVHIAYAGSEGIATARKVKPELLMLDLGMPTPNGYEVCRVVRNEFGKDVFIVAVTGWGQAEDRRRSALAGFDYHVVKPVDDLELANVLALCAKARTRPADTVN